MKYLVQISGGAGSTLALERVIEQHGVDNAEAFFGDTGFEDPTLYALLAHIEERHPTLTLHHFGGEEDIWDVFMASGIILTPQGRHCKASYELKTKPCATYIAEHYAPPDVRIVFGFDHTEEDRIRKRAAGWAPYKIYCPLAEPPLLSNCEIKSAVDRMGYPEQTLYVQGYQHNNCQGACVKAGLSQWHMLYLDNRPLYLTIEEWEQRFIARYCEGKEPYTILKDQSGVAVPDGRGGVMMEYKAKPMTLREFRERIERNDPTLNLRDFRSTCGCTAPQGNLFEDIEILAA